MNKIQKKIIVNGIVQGVGFRPFVYRLARMFDLKGYVKNTESGVEIVIEGCAQNIEDFLENLKRPPPISKIVSIKVKDGNFGKFERFEIIKSSSTGKISTLVPPDIGMCEECKTELFDKTDKRFGYFFITCTNCGPRFTIVENLPYDREKTTMKFFKMCEDCEKEYFDVNNRRYEAQTIACQRCGPKLYLFDKNGKAVKGDALRKACEAICKEKIVAIKGVGGFHIACLATKSNVVKRLRSGRKKSNKPFAIMAKDVNIVKTFAIVNSLEEKLLTSFEKPIVVLKKSKNYWLSEEISPYLHTIGVMLPYSGLHYLIFEHIAEPIVMTSANLPGEPTTTEEREVFEKLSHVVDYFLVHDRKIHQRCDDSVIRVLDKPVFLRRSRGFVPLPIEINVGGEVVLALGAELSNNFCIYKENKAFLSQHIGDTSNYETLEALKKDVEKWSKLLGIKNFDKIVCDLHPQFLTTKFGESLAEKYSAKIIKAQHHFAHLSSCMAENGLKEAVGIVCDGYGYGADKNAWGGEIILAKNGTFKRCGHLEYQPLIGGDLATIHPKRIAVGILSKTFDEKTISEVLRLRVKNVKIWLEQVQQNFNIVYSSSCGRFLDAVSATLGICEYRSYEGEPAMRLESVASRGKRIIELPIKIKKNVLLTTPLLASILHTKAKKEDIALSIHFALAKGLAALAKRIAERENIEHICFTGGVAFNEIFNNFLRKEIPKLIVQTKVPPGDGGISLGQLYFSNYCTKY
ncbi:MAG: carbamoyltransferase HypF [Candidatus Aenigmarchaeota archaeon]|nr:carbamoyltransferase HypF [Candidatus Aenigmarchaeota archaeon]